MSSRKGKSTRRSKVLTGKIMNIPELKEAFEALNAKTHALLKKSGDSMDETVREFQGLWKSIFHRPVTKEAALAFLEVKRSSSGKGKRGKSRKQKGGAAAPPLAGAPLDYMTRPGIDLSSGSTYVSVPAYQAQGLDSYNKFNTVGIDQDTRDLTPLVPKSIGTNEV
jgi:hypothetical protein